MRHRLYWLNLQEAVTAHSAEKIFRLEQALGGVTNPRCKRVLVSGYPLKWEKRAVFYKQPKGSEGKGRGWTARPSLSDLSYSEALNTLLPGRCSLLVKWKGQGTGYKSMHHSSLDLDNAV